MKNAHLHFLGRGMMNIAGKARNVFWFTVTREE